MADLLAGFFVCAETCFISLAGLVIYFFAYLAGVALPDLF